MKKLKSVGFALLYLAITISVQFIVMFGMMFQGAIAGMSMEQIMDFFTGLTDDYKNNLILVSMINLVYIAGFGVWYYLIRTRKEHSPVQYRKILSVPSVFCMATMAVCAQLCCNILMVGVKLLVPKVFDDYLKLVEGLDISVMPAWAMILIVAVWAPLAEEVIFRAMIYRTLRKGFSFVIAAMISGVLFGAYHMNWVQGIYAAALGVLLAYIYEKTNSLLGCYLYHFFFNLCSYALGEIQEIIPLPEIIWGAIILMGSVLAIPALVFLIRWFGKIFGGEREAKVEYENI